MPKRKSKRKEGLALQALHGRGHSLDLIHLKQESDAMGLPPTTLIRLPCGGWSGMGCDMYGRARPAEGAVAVQVKNSALWTRMVALGTFFKNRDSWNQPTKSNYLGSRAHKSPLSSDSFAFIPARVQEPESGNHWVNHRKLLVKC